RPFRRDRSVPVNGPVRTASMEGISLRDQSPCTQVLFDQSQMSLQTDAHLTLGTPAALEPRISVGMIDLAQHADQLSRISLQNPVIRPDPVTVGKDQLRPARPDPETNESVG